MNKFRNILLDLVIALAVAGFAYFLSYCFRSCTQNDADVPKTAKLETVSEISELSEGIDNSAFENWVVKKFDFERPNLSLLEHNAGEGKDAASLLIEMDTDNESISYMIAVECIWRKEISSKGLYWATEATLKRYMNSADEDDAKLFLIFGLGGSPDAPKSVYIVPIRFLQERVLSPSDLANYECESTHGILDYEVPAHKLVLH
ncbi:MAG: hypothetical protein K6E86_10280 [Bacteroidales bacterium]|nr:hypothetical protein [Bacteroidales bacterium]